MPSEDLAIVSALMKPDYEPWEYLVKSFSRYGDNAHDVMLTKALDELGGQEWELVTFTGDNAGSYKAIFKRKRR
jgi:hypothetical protein